MYNSGRNVMKLTIVLYNNKEMIGKYLVDTISKTLDTFEWVSIPELNDEKFILEDHHPNLNRK